MVHVPEASVQSVKSNPEKQIAAMHMKNMNSAVIARRALRILVSSRCETCREERKDTQDNNIVGDQEKCKSELGLENHIKAS